VPGTPVTVFISYSRRDSNFVDRLEAGLKASNFHTWVVRRNVEISQTWKKVLQDAIDRCDIALIVLSSASVTSPYVQMEYKYALSIEKQLILLEYQNCSAIPDALLGIQKVDFSTNTRDGLRNLLIALNHVEIEPSSRLQQPTDVEQAGLHSTTDATSVITESVPASTIPDLETIYIIGVIANERKNLDLATALWREILIRDPHFHNCSLADEYGKMLSQLRSYHVTYFRNHALEMQNAKKWRQAAGFWQDLLAQKPQDSQARRSLDLCLRTQGEKSSASGEWDQAISIWETLLKLKPGDAQATRQLSLAKNNLFYAQYYKDAQQCIADGALSPARTLLHQLWQNAPYYGDPKELARKVGMTIYLRSPATLDKEEEERLAKEQKEREARERERQAREQQEKEVQEARLLEMKRTPAWFIQNDLGTTRFVVWCSLFFLLSGLGTAIGILTQSGFLAINTIAITVLLAYIFGFHRAIHRLPERFRQGVNQNVSYAQTIKEDLGQITLNVIAFLAIIIISSFIALLFVNSVSFLAYNSPQVSHILWFIRSWSLFRQFTVGLIIGATLSIITFSLSQPKRLKVALGKALIWGTVWGISCWLFCALLALIFDWGFGFGNGWNVSLLGLVVGVIAGTGISSSFIICMKGKPIF
jgi:tetratricopeptide (TPR) repeat protein